MTIHFQPDESILKLDVQTLICPVNCTGVMGSGLSLTFSKTFKGLLYHYRKACERGELAIIDDTPSFWVHKVNNKLQVLCFPTEREYNDRPQRETIIRGMDKLVKEYQHYGIRSLGIPMKIGSESGCFSWDDISNDVVSHLSKLSIPVTIFGSVTQDQK